MDGLDKFKKASIKINSEVLKLNDALDYADKKITTNAADIDYLKKELIFMKVELKEAKNEIRTMKQLTFFSLLKRWLYNRI